MTSRRFGIIAIGLFALAGVWTLISHHRANQEAELWAAATDRVA